ncbi:MAG: hypothetical protein RI907_1325 [Pseudomonadota bacterium]|jgi:tetratricopeptide (TPR) repeat protein
MNTHTLALVMIVRNEARCLARCLASVQGLVDQMVVLDTGSTDDTVAIAQAAGAEVAHFKWVDDFSAARNAALALSRCDWALVLDADETLRHTPTGLQALQALKQTAPTFVGRIAVHSSFGVGGTQQAPSWLSRVLPRGARFEGVVHEQVTGPWPRQDLPLEARHDGYEPAQMAHKGDRNRQLLEHAVRLSPQDPYWQYQLGKDHEVHDRFPQALQAYLKAWPTPPGQSPRQPGWRHDLLVRMMFVLKAAGHLDQALELARAQAPHWPDSPDFHFVWGDLLLEQAILAPQRADALLPQVQQAWQRCLQIGENPRLEGAVHGRGSHLARHNLALLQDVMASL